MTFIPPTLPLPGAASSALPGFTDAEGVVAAEIPCRKCGYNLRGLHVEGRCPECGRAVGLSVRGDFLRYSDPGWVRKLHRGIRMIIWAIVVIVLGVILGVALGIGMGNATIAAAAPVTAVLIGYVLYLVGTWLLTEPDPSGVGEDQYGTSRKIIRIALVLGVINQAMEIARQFAPIPAALQSTLTLVGFIFSLAGLVAIFAQLQYLKKLAMRIPDPQLAGRAHFLMYAIAISYGLVIVFGILTGVMAGGGPGGPIAAVGCITGIAIIAILVFAIMYLLMIERMGKRFAQEADAAEATWARVDGAAGMPALPVQG
jgi:hypothetical protein